MRPVKRLVAFVPGFPGILRGGVRLSGRPAEISGYVAAFVSRSGGYTAGMMRQADQLAPGPTRRRGSAWPWLGAVWALVLANAAGCSTIDPLNVRSLGRPPLRVGVARYEITPKLLFLPKWGLLNDDLALHLNEPVAFELLKPWQISVHLGTGRLKFAFLSARDYCEVASTDNHKILAVPIDNRGRTTRRGLIVVPPNSPVQSLPELKGLRFHFLPEGDDLNDAALGALLEAGVVKTDLDKGLLGLELDTRHISSAEVVKSVVLEGKAAGVIDETDYEQWPEKGGALLLPIPLPSKDQVRVIAKTVLVPNGPFVVSNETPPELAEKVGNYLLNVVSQHKLQNRLVLDPLDYKGFAPPIDRKEYEAFFAICRKLYPPEFPTEEESPAATSSPATAAGGS